MSKLFIAYRIQLVVVILGCFLCMAPSAFADVPVSLTQQGRLLTHDGEPMQGPKTLLFELYDAPTDGNVVWSGEFDVDLGDSGYYAVILGDADNPLDHTAFQVGPTFMQMAIDQEPLLPRLELTSVPYAQIAKIAETAGHASTAGRADSVKNGSINTAAIADKAVTAEKIASIPWDKITNQPSIPTYSGADFVTSGQSCTTAGQMVTGISASGTLLCATPEDQDTKYTAGSGLVLNGTRFSIASGGITDDNIVDMSWTKVTDKPEITSFTSSDFAKSDQGCDGIDVVLGFNSDGTVNCGPPNDTTYTIQPNQGLSITNNRFGVATSGITHDHIANGAVGTQHLATGAITLAKVKAPAAIYTVTNKFCDEPFGSVSLTDHCKPNQDDLTDCDLCAPPTQAGNSPDPVRLCNGLCECKKEVPQCPNQKLGYIFPAVSR